MLKHGAYVINIDENESIGIHWTAFSVNGENLTYFDSFRVENISIKITKFIGSKNIYWYWIYWFIVKKNPLS